MCKISPSKTVPIAKSRISNRPQPMITSRISKSTESISIRRKPVVMSINENLKNHSQLTASARINLVTDGSKTMGDNYGSKIRKVIDEELNFLGEEVKSKVANRMNDILKDAVYEGIKMAFNNGFSKVKEQMNTKQPQMINLSDDKTSTDKRSSTENENHSSKLNPKTDLIIDFDEKENNN